jgi:ATP-dependent RNA helicase RhlB
MKFTEFDLSPEILKGIEDAGFTDCTQVQEETYRHSFNGKDICVQSQTGTGKTAAYLVAIFKLFTDNMVPTKKALIMVPTRELAVQIDKETKLLGKYLKFKSTTFFGGVGYAPQEQALREGVDIMIATPGRLIDLYKSGKVTLNDISVLVIDEADRMFDMGFIPDIRYLIKKMPGAKERRTMLFSATLSHKVKGLAWEYMNDPVEIDIMPENLTVDTITQALYHVGTDEKFRLLLGLLKKHNPNNAIVFTNMKRTAEYLSKKLSANGYPNEYIMGDLPQKKRQKVIDGIKKGEIRFLIATDVAARGLHVDDLDMVFNYDLPEDCENYVHRIGRTARAGKSGIAISLACERYVQSLETIEEYISMKIPVEWFTEDMLAEDVSSGIRVEYDRKRGEQRGKSKRKEDHPRRDNKFREKKPYHEKSHSEKQHHQEKSVTKHSHFEKTKSHHIQSKQTIHRGKPEDKHTTKVQVHGKKVSPRRDGTLEERLAFYRDKYGDDFKFTGETSKSKNNKKSLLQKIKSLFIK